MHPGTYSLERIGQRRRVLASPLGHVGAAAALAPDAGRDVGEEFARADPAASSAADASDQRGPPPLDTRQNDHCVAQLLPQPVDRFAQGLHIEAFQAGGQDLDAVQVDCLRGQIGGGPRGRPGLEGLEFPLKLLLAVDQRAQLVGNITWGTT